MKKLVSLIYGCISLVAISSCTNSYEEMVSEKSSNLQLSEKEYASIAFDNPGEIPATELLEMVKSFICQNPENLSMTRGNGNFRVKDIISKKVSNVIETNQTTRSDFANDFRTCGIPCYDIYVEYGGKNSYVFASADERAPGVLAYFPDFPTDERDIAIALNNPNTKAIISMASSQLIKDITVVEQVRKLYRDETIEKICSQLAIPISSYDYNRVKDRIEIVGGDAFALTRSSNAYYSIPTQVIAYRLPMTPLRWDQRPPYNRALPVEYVKFPSDYYPSYKNVPAGCTVIATALLESIIQRPVVNGVSVNWSLLRQDSVLIEAIPELGQTGSSITKLNMAGNLIKGIYEELNAYSFVKENTTYTSATIVNPNDFWSYMYDNFYSSGLIMFNPDSVLLSMYNNRPVILCGPLIGNDGPGTESYVDYHSFIIDGYVQAKKSTPSLSIMETKAEILKKDDLYWHANLGWGPYSAAYFKLNDDTTCTIDFTDSYGRDNLIYLSQQQIFSNIRAK